VTEAVSLADAPPEFGAIVRDVDAQATSAAWKSRAR
jgi:hypothetical protein